MAKAVKLADIAAKCNVSTVTVSKALSDQKGVSEQMREQIKKLAREMGYQAPSAAKQDKMKKSYTIGVLVSRRYFAQQTSFYWQIYQEVATKAVSKGCFTMLEILEQVDEQERNLPKMLQENVIDGLIIIGLLKEDYFDTLVNSIKVPFVCLDFYDKRHDCDAIISNNYYGMYKLTNHLFDMGHTRIAYVGTLLYTESITDRYFGYCKSLLEHGTDVRQDWVLGDRDMVTGEIRGEYEVKLPAEMPTAFVCNCDMTAGVLIELLRSKGYRVPEDISVVGFDNYVYPGICSLGITTYAVDIKEMARKSIHNLIKKMSGEPYKQGITIVDGYLVYKESVQDIRG